MFLAGDLGFRDWEQLSRRTQSTSPNAIDGAAVSVLVKRSMPCVFEPQRQPKRSLRPFHKGRFEQSVPRWSPPIEGIDGRSTSGFGGRVLTHFASSAALRQPHAAW